LHLRAVVEEYNEILRGDGEIQNGVCIREDGVRCLGILYGQMKREGDAVYGDGNLEGAEGAQNRYQILPGDFCVGNLLQDPVYAVPVKGAGFYRQRIGSSAHGKRGGALCAVSVGIREENADHMGAGDSLQGGRIQLCREGGGVRGLCDKILRPQGESAGFAEHRYVLQMKGRRHSIGYRQRCAKRKAKQGKEHGVLSLCPKGRVSQIAFQLHGQKGEPAEIAALRQRLAGFGPKGTERSQKESCHKEEYGGRYAAEQYKAPAAPGRGCFFSRAGLGLNFRLFYHGSSDSHSSPLSSGISVPQLRIFPFASMA